MADAVGADAAFFSTCGSSLSVKAAMMAVAGGDRGGLLLGRDSRQIGGRRSHIFRSATLLDHTQMGCSAALFASTVAGSGTDRLGRAP